MSCADDLTLDDLTSSSTQVLERVSAGEGAHRNLWGQIDRDKSVEAPHQHSFSSDQERVELS